MLRFLFTLAALAVFGVAPLHAGSWKTQEVKWMITSQGSPTSATAIYQRDTSFAALGTAVKDTTGWFNLKDVDPPPLINGAVPDTLTLGYLLLATDSTAVVAQTTTNVRIQFQLAPKTEGPLSTRPANMANGLLAIGVMTSGARAAVVPITIVQRGPNGSNDMFQLASLGDFNIRGITETITGGGMPMARAFFVYYDAEN